MDLNPERLEVILFLHGDDSHQIQAQSFYQRGFFNLQQHFPQESVVQVSVIYN